ncbi:MAG: histidine phosphatase family protein [Pseudomonadota bacterium]
MRFISFLLVCALSLGWGAAAAQTPSADIPAPVVKDGRLGPAYRPLIEALRGGGHVILFRHDRTILNGLWDFESRAPGSCDRERNLSEAGRASARAIGDAIDRLGIPVRRVVTSTYCRAVDTGTSMFGGVHLKTDALLGANGAGRTGEDVRRDVARIIAQEAPAGGVLVLVGHSGTIKAFTTRLLDEGDALILTPQSDGGLDVAAHIPAARWEEIARDLIRSEIRERASK